MDRIIRLASCACGTVRCEGVGAPIVSVVCYCSDCQEGGRKIEALPGAPRVPEADGGASYLTYRDDRFRCVSGAQMLVAYRSVIEPQRVGWRRLVAIPACFSNLSRGFGFRPTASVIPAICRPLKCVIKQGIAKPRPLFRQMRPAFHDFQYAFLQS